jgi:pectin methylesterase-like acyl-CoA thioesterase
MKNLNPLSGIVLFPVLIGLLAFSPRSQAGTAVWTAGSAITTNWSDGGNWSGGTGTSGVPGSGDDVVFKDTGNATVITAISNAVDSTSGNFAGTISSLSYTNTVANSYQNTLIASGVTLNITNNTGPFGSALFVGTPTVAVANSIFASIQGPGATLNINNPKAIISIDQVASSSVRATLILSNLDNFIANVSRVAVGSDQAGLATAAGQGTLYLAKTNTITTAWVGDYSQPYVVNVTNAIDIGKGNAGNIGANYLYLGKTNGIFTDSIGVGRVKDTTSPGGVLSFNPVFTNSNPTAYFRGISGNASRVTSWGIGDNAQNSSSSATTIGNVDFSCGTVDVLVDTMFLGRDREKGSAASLSGTLTFTAGTIDANTLTIGNQCGTNTGSACLGTVYVNGPSAKLVVNTTLELGHTTLLSPTTSALNTKGVLAINAGTVCAKNVIVGAASITNIITMNSATLVVSNTLATNASGLLSLTMTNSYLELTVSDTSLKGQAGTVTTGGATNMIWLSSVPVFNAYPKQFALIKYTNSSIAGAGFNIGLTNVPVTAPNAYLSNNVLNRSIDLVLPTAPYPAITAQPLGLAISPGDTANYTVTATGVAPLIYQWSKNGTNLTDGGNIAGSTTSALTITNVQTSDNANYSVSITNVYGAVTSGPAILFVSASDVAPFITAQPQSSTVLSNQNATFTVGGIGKPLPAYQWQKNGTNLVDGGNISGSTTPTLGISLAQLSDEGTYSVILTNTVGSTNSDSVTLTVNIPPTISVQPKNTNALNGAGASFTVTASGKPDPTYQWLKGGFPITDQTNSTLAFASVAPSDAATYSVIVSNAAGLVVSSSATLIVNSTMAATSLSPANAAIGICPDTPLQITFNTAPVLGSAGKIYIYNTTNAVTPVDTIDLGLNTANGVQPRTIAGSTFNTYPVIISGNTANIYPHLGVLTTNQTYYVTIENVISGAFKDSAGATFVGISATNTWRFATKTAGPAAGTTNLVVAADGSGDFCTVQGVVDFLPSGNTAHVLVNVHNGTYTEIVRLISKNNITFRGQNRTNTVITYANNDTLNGGTAARPMLGVSANDVAIENLTLTNSTPKGGSQAEALYLNSAKRFILCNADLKSFQDTLLVNANGDQAYLKNNFIQGDTDFIWGAGTVFFTNCEIKTLNSGSVSSPQSVTQARTVAGVNGMSFVNCQLTRLNGNITNASLGRSLGYTDGNVAYINCTIDGHVTGWVDALVRSWEYGNISAVTGMPTNYNGTQLTNNDPRLLLALDATNWFSGWTPTLAPNITGQPANQTLHSGPASFTVSATGIPDPAYQWLKNGSPIADATNATLTFSSVQLSNAASYTVIVSNVAGTVTSSAATLTVNDAVPVANPSAYSRPAGFSLKMALVGDLATNWSDTDGDPLALTGGISSTNGATVSYDSDYVYYQDANDVADQINYTIGDGIGGTAAGVITINVLTGGTVGGTQSITVSGNSATVNFAGIPNYQYEIQRSTNLVDWVTLLTTNAPGNGVFKFTDDFSDLGGVAPPAAYYRTARP